MEKKLLQLLLNHEFYTNNKARLVKTMFPDQFELIYELICEAHDKYQRTITTSELRQLFKIKYPVIPQAQSTTIQEYIIEIGDTDEKIGEDVAKDVIQSMWKIELGRQIAEFGMKLVENKDAPLTELSKLIEKANSDYTPSDQIVPVNTDIDAILEASDNVPRWKFNIPILAFNVPGIGAGEFAAVFARPEVGKTAFHISSTFGPGGFLHQRARVHVLLNEESAVRTVSRGIVCATGMSVDEIKANRPRAKELYAPLQRYLTVIESTDFTPASVEAYCKQHKPDVLIVDQIDKLKTEKGFAREDQEMGYIYVSFRESLIRHKVAGIGLCQASNDAEGKTTVLYSMMAKSKTDKAAELDLALGIGAQPQSEGQSQTNQVRYLTASKNKISGWHGTVNCMLQQKLHRYVS